MRVAVPELNLRKEPSIAAAIVDLLTPENVLRLYDGPEEADGYTWYRGVETSLGPLTEPPGDAVGENPSGWLAVAKGATAYVTRVPPRCPTTVDLVNVAGQLPAERLECFGSNPLVVEGVFGCGDCGGTVTGVFEPAWLANRLYGDVLSVAVHDGRQLHLRFPPDGPLAPPGGSILRVTGHFDDPAARTCQVAVPPRDGPPEASPVPIDPAISVLRCRQEFVVDAFEVLGVDPSFGVQ